VGPIKQLIDKFSLFEINHLRWLLRYAPKKIQKIHPPKKSIKKISKKIMPKLQIFGFFVKFIIGRILLV
jgi:hypothetical protein